MPAICTARLRSVSPLNQSRPVSLEKETGENAEAYEERTWSDRCHSDEDGNVFIPPMALKQSVDAACKFLSIPIPGKARSTYTKHFLSGVICFDEVFIGKTVADMERSKVFCNSDGVRGSGKRVWRSFPSFRSWEGDVTFHVLDDVIDKKTFQRVLSEAGKLIGLGQFRPQNGGYFGRFEVVEFDWKKS